ncbi:MAG: hypothetical protein AAFZ92_02945 [Pseudomonadota bacterium]
MIFFKVLGLFACSSQPDYQQAKSLPAIKAPAGSSDDRLGQLYVVPQQQVVSVNQDGVPFPPSVGVQDDANIASLQTLNQQFWVLNAKSPASTWSQLLSFFQARNIDVPAKDLSRAEIDTGWFQQALQPGFVARYRLRLERGLQPDTTEIFIGNETRTVAERDSATPMPADAIIGDRAHGLWFANELVRALNNPNAKIRDSFLASTIQLPEKVRLATLDQESVMYINLDKPRLDNAIGKALDQKGLRPYATDSQQGVYYFDEYDSDQGESRWWNPLSWNVTFSDQQAQQSPFTLDEILTHLPNEPAINALFPDVSSRQAGKALTRLEGYLLVKREQQGRTTLYIRDAYGRPLSLNRGRQLLDTIRLRLI